VRQLLAAARGDRGLVVIEGFHALKHALRFGADVLAAGTTDPDGLAALAEELAPDLALAGLVATVGDLGPDAHHTGVVAVARRPPFDPDALGPGRVVLLDAPRHPGNVGAAVRVAAAAGAAGLLVTGERDPWAPAALRGSAGLHFALPVGRVAAPPTDRPLIAVHPRAQPGDEAAGRGRWDPLATLPDDAVLAFGSERHGLGAALLARADARVGIPMRPGVSSLNLATAVAVVLYA